MRFTAGYFITATHSLEDLHCHKYCFISQEPNCEITKNTKKQQRTINVIMYKAINKIKLRLDTGKCQVTTTDRRTENSTRLQMIFSKARKSRTRDRHQLIS